MNGPALLFCPGDRPDRYAKAAAAADSVIIDLEDAVALADKPSARASVVASNLDPATTVIRVNPAGTREHALDLEALRATDYTTVMLAKTEHAVHVDSLESYGVIALCETALGVMNADQIAQHPSTIGLMWGAEDLIASMHGRSSRLADGRYRDVARVARSQVLLAARAYEKAAVDSVHLDIPDLAGLRAEVEDAAASGFTATACIHPCQVGTIRAGYASTDEERAWARAVLDEAARQSGVFRFRGLMVDEPLLRQARQVLG